LAKGPATKPTIETVEETGSTNADLLARLAAGEQLPEGYWLKAERQTGGRGRLGRKWESPRGNLYCSTIVNPSEDDPPAHTLSLVTGLACFDTLVRSLLPRTPVMLKWPNDAQIRGAKIAGMLLERSGDTVVVGIGVNVCHAPNVAGRETTSILYENGKHGGSEDLVLSILADCFADHLTRWRCEPLPGTIDRWMEAAHPIGTPLSVAADGGPITGAFAGLDAEGALLLRLDNGAMRTIHAGDVSMIAQEDS
jgi:BirA family biotin operon repressor/biotin-[acetyl-CoA-carboxylase] ligase